MQFLRPSRANFCNHSGCYCGYIEPTRGTRTCVTVTLSADVRQKSPSTKHTSHTYSHTPSPPPEPLSAIANKSHLPIQRCHRIMIKSFEHPYLGFYPYGAAVGALLPIILYHFGIMQLQPIHNLVHVLSSLHIISSVSSCIFTFHCQIWVPLIYMAKDGHTIEFIIKFVKVLYEHYAWVFVIALFGTVMFDQQGCLFRILWETHTSSNISSHPIDDAKKHQQDKQVTLSSTDQLFYVHVDGTRYTLNGIKSSDTVSVLINEIHHKTAVPLTHLRVAYRGIVLDEDVTLYDCGIGPESTVVLWRAIQGGNGNDHDPIEGAPASPNANETPTNDNTLIANVVSVDADSPSAATSANVSNANSNVSANANAASSENPFMYEDDERARILAVEEEMKKRFPVCGKQITYPTGKHIVDQINEGVGRDYGFTVSLSSKTISCTLADLSDSQKRAQAKRSKKVPANRKRKRKSNRCGCKFYLKVANVESRDLKKGVYITEASYQHTNGCSPSTEQYTAQMIAGGRYTKSIDMREGLQALLNMMRYNPNVDAITIRNVLKEKLPASVPVEAPLIANVRERLKKMLAQQGRADDENRKMMAQLTTEEAAKLMDDATADAAGNKFCGLDLDNPEYVGVATDKLRVLLREALNQGKEMDQILSLLQRTKEVDPGFDYRVARDSYGKVTAIVWQDRIQRGNCKNLLDVVMLDMMKRQQNSVDWPYCGPVFISGHEHSIALGAEAILITESIDAYVFVMNATYEMSGVDRTVTRVIFADGIMSLTLLRKLGIENTCNLVLDRYHLVDVDWAKAFGWHYPKIKPLMRKLVDSKTEEEYQQTFELVRSKCPSAIHQTYLEKEVHVNRHHFVAYWTKSYEGHLNRNGDQGSEANHSSYCQRISFGSFIQPAEQVVQCLERSKDIAKARDQTLFKYFSEVRRCAIEINQSSNISFEDAQNRDAMLSLGKDGYELFKECQAEAMYYSKRPSSEHPGLMEVFRSEDQISPPRLIGDDHPCDCQKRIAFLSLCPHQLVYDDGHFIKSRFAPRFHMQKGVLSLNRPDIATSNLKQPPETMICQDAGTAPSDTFIHDDDTAAAELLSQSNQFEIGTADADAGESQPPKKQKRSSNFTNKPDRWDYNKCLAYLKPIADVIANHPDQRMCIGALEGMKELFQGVDFDPNLTLEERFNNHLSQFNNHNQTSQFVPSSSGTAVTSSFAAAMNIAGGDMMHRTHANRGRPNKSRKKPAVEMTAGSGGSKKHCHFCQCSNSKDHTSKNGCSAYQSLKPSLVTKENKTSFQCKLGDPTLHKFSSCPITIEKIVKSREESDCTVQPWPLAAGHIVLKEAYYDFDVPSFATRFARDPREGNSVNNIIGLQFLEWEGAVAIKDASTGRDIFYYRVREVQSMIADRIKGDKLLFDCLPEKQ